MTDLDSLSDDEPTKLAPGSSVPSTDDYVAELEVGRVVIALEAASEFPFEIPAQEVISWTLVPRMVQAEKTTGLYPEEIWWTGCWVALFETGPRAYRRLEAGRVFPKKVGSRTVDRWKKWNNNCP